MTQGFFSSSDVSVFSQFITTDPGVSLCAFCPLYRACHQTINIDMNQIHVSCFLFFMQFAYINSAYCRPFLYKPPHFLWRFNTLKQFHHFFKTSDVRPFFHFQSPLRIRFAVPVHTVRPIYKNRPPAFLPQEACLKRMLFYLFSMVTYGCLCTTERYAGRIMRPPVYTSSILCAHQPAIRAMAKSGVYNSSGMPSIW